jgi:hypothetical protein
VSTTVQLRRWPHEGAVTPEDAIAGAALRRGVAWYVGGVAVALLPAGLTVYMAFRTGAYYAETYAGMLAFLAVALGVTAVVSRHPFAGWSTELAVAGIALGLLVVWTWFSSEWSDAPQRALFESQRTALYLLALLVFGAYVRRRGGLATVVTGLAAAILAVCIAALATRLYPDVFTVSSTLSPQRLSFPISYWNALGLFAAIGVVLLLHVSADLRTLAVVRAIAAAGIPAAAATIYFTFSRGATGAVALGVAAYVVLARPRGIVSAALAVAPATVFALREAYAADLLGTTRATSAAAAAQGHDVAVALALACAFAGVVRLALIPLDKRFDRLPPLSREGRRMLLVGAVAAVLLGGVVAVAADLPGRVDSAYQSFTKPEAGGDARTRFQQVTLSGRQDHWDVALGYYRSHRLTGVGAGTYETQWLRSRPGVGVTDQAHSLYIETLSELGLVGVGLLVAALLAMFWGLLRRARGSRRPIFAAVFAALLMWAVHAGVDWDWELPAVGFGLFALTGIALAEPTVTDGWRRRVYNSWAFRAAVALACLFVCVTAVRTVIADAALDEAKNRIDSGDCRGATADARSALSAVATHPAAYEIVGWCAVYDGREAAAVKAMRKATSLDPTQWRYRYGLAVATAASGSDPRPALRRARRLDPHAEIFTTGTGAELAKARPRPTRWRRLAANASRPTK